MKKILAFVLIVVFVFSFAGCGEDSKTVTRTDVSSQISAESQVVKEEVELVLEKTVWQLQGESFYMLFSTNKRVTVYDLSKLDGTGQDVGKYLTYEIGKENNQQTISIFYLLDSDKTIFNYNSQEKTFILSDDSKTKMEPIEVKTFVEAYEKQIEAFALQGENQWTTQAEINEGSGMICTYWNNLYQLIDVHLESVLPAEQYKTFQQENKTFELQRDVALQEAGEQIDGASASATVINDVYCTQTQKRIATIKTKYFQ